MRMVMPVALASSSSLPLKTPTRRAFWHRGAETMAPDLVLLTGARDDGLDLTCLVARRPTFASGADSLERSSTRCVIQRAVVESSFQDCALRIPCADGSFHTDVGDELHV